MKKFVVFVALIAAMFMIVTACSSQSTGSFPNKNIEFIAPASPGGGWDATARAMQKILSDEGLIKDDIVVVNKPGGGGEVGWTYLKEKDAHSLAINSSLVLTNNILGKSKLTYEQFTPIAILATEWQAIAVAKDSEIKSASEMMKKLKENPKSLKIAVAPSLGNDDHLSFVQAAKTFGVDVTKLDFLIYESGGDVVTALLGKHVDIATMSVSEAKEQYLAGKFRILAVSSDERLKGLEDIPTWKDEGVDMVFPHWRGVMGPPNMTAEEIAYWDDKLSKMVNTDAWKKLLNNNEWDSFYKNSTETKQFLAEQNKMYDQIITESGLK